MSQIDKIIYLPLLSWYWILLVALYFVIFTYILGSFFSTYRIRIIFFDNILLSSLHIINFSRNYWSIRNSSNKNKIKSICTHR